MISVIVPVYNAESYLKKCLDSIVDQDYRDLEVIVVNDGSIDGSPEICEEYAKKDSRIRLFHQSNKGPMYAKKKGIEKARGDYITFVDADDYIDAGVYSTILSSLDGLPDMIIYGLKEINSNCVIKKNNYFEPGVYDNERMNNEIVPFMLSHGSFFDFGILPNLVCKMIRRSFINRSNLILSDEVTVGDDADITFQLIAQANKIQLIDIYPYNYIRHDSSVMDSMIEIKMISELYNDLKSGFIHAGVYDVMKAQLEDYITFIRLLKAPESVKDVDEFFTVEGSGIALYGAGGFGQALYGRYKDSISLWVDRDHKKYSEKGLPVGAIEDLLDVMDCNNMVFIAVLNSDVCREIMKDLVNIGLKEDSIYYYDRGIV